MSRLSNPIERFCLECGVVFGCWFDKVVYSCNEPLDICESQNCVKKLPKGQHPETPDWCPECLKKRGDEK